VLEPLLQNISDFLDDHEELIEPVPTRSATRFEKPQDWSRRIDATTSLALLIVMRVKSWDYRELRETDRRRIHPCASSRISTCQLCPNTMRSTAPLTG